MHAIDHTSELIKKLQGAKAWPEQLSSRSDSGEDIFREIETRDKQVESLKKEAQETMKKLGCVSPETRTVYQHMADMLIAWHTFKDMLSR